MTVTQLLALGGLQRPDLTPASRLLLPCRFLSPLGFPGGRGGQGASCWCPRVGGRSRSSFGFRGSPGEASPQLFQVLLWAGRVRPLGSCPEHPWASRGGGGEGWGPGWETVVAPPRWPQPLCCVPCVGAQWSHMTEGSSSGQRGVRERTEGDGGLRRRGKRDLEWLRERGATDWLLCGPQSARRLHAVPLLREHLSVQPGVPQGRAGRSGRQPAGVHVGGRWFLRAQAGG